MQGMQFELLSESSGLGAPGAVFAPGVFAFTSHVGSASAPVENHQEQIAPSLRAEHPTPPVAAARDEVQMTQPTATRVGASFKLAPALRMTLEHRRSSRIFISRAPRLSVFKGGNFSDPRPRRGTRKQRPRRRLSPAVTTDGSGIIGYARASSSEPIRMQGRKTTTRKAAPPASQALGPHPHTTAKLGRIAFARDP